MAYKYSKTKIDKIAGYIAEGFTKGRAVYLAGIKSRQTFYNWENGVGVSTEEQMYILDALKGAEEERENTLLQNIYKAGQEGKWQASAWLLERLYGEKYRRTSKFEATVEPHENIRKLAVSDERVADTVIKSLLLFVDKSIPNEEVIIEEEDD